LAPPGTDGIETSFNAERFAGGISPAAMVRASVQRKAFILKRAATASI
jgi:hypothetical protein